MIKKGVKKHDKQNVIKDTIEIYFIKYKQIIPLSFTIFIPKRFL